MSHQVFNWWQFSHFPISGKQKVKLTYFFLMLSYEREEERNVNHLKNHRFQRALINYSCITTTHKAARQRGLKVLQCLRWPTGSLPLLQDIRTSMSFIPLYDLCAGAQPRGVTELQAQDHPHSPNLPTSQDQRGWIRRVTELPAPNTVPRLYLSF